MDRIGISFTTTTNNDNNNNNDTRVSTTIFPATHEPVGVLGTEWIEACLNVGKEG